MVVELGVSWNEVYNTWKEYYHYKGEAAKVAFDRFFHHSRFFAPNSPTSDIPLSLAASTITGNYDVIIALHICEQLYMHLCDAIPHVEPPSLNDLTPLNYEIIQRFVATASKVLTKNLHKAKKKNAQLEKLREAKREANFAQALLKSKKYVFISIDIEAYEREHSILLEIGWSMYDSKTNRFMDQHYINDAYPHLRNGHFVDDERDRFIFGTSVHSPLKRALKELKKDLDWATSRDGGFVLVGHGLEHDLKYLSKQKFLWPTQDGGETLDLGSSAKIAILNTDTIYGASVNDILTPPSLGKTLGLLNIDTWHLHNAGNDAHYTLLLLLKLASDFNI